MGKSWASILLEFVPLLVLIKIISPNTIPRELHKHPLSESISVGAFWGVL